MKMCAQRIDSVSGLGNETRERSRYADAVVHNERSLVHISTILDAIYLVEHGSDSLHACKISCTDNV